MICQAGIYDTAPIQSEFDDLIYYCANKGQLFASPNANMRLGLGPALVRAAKAFFAPPKSITDPDANRILNEPRKAPSGLFNRPCPFHLLWPIRSAHARPLPFLRILRMRRLGLH